MAGAVLAAEQRDRPKPTSRRHAAGLGLPFYPAPPPMLRPIAFALLPCLLSHAAHARPDLHIAVDNNSPPFAYEDARHQPQGIYVQLLQHIAQQSGLRLAIRPMPWRRALQGLALGQHGVAGLYSNAERQQRYLMSAPLWQESLHVFTLPTASLQVGRSEDLAGLKLGTLAGWYYSDKLQAMQQRGELVLESGESDLQNIGKLRAGRLDAILAVKDSVDHLLQHHPRNPIRLPLRDAGMLLRNATYLALPRTQGNIALLQRINAALQQLQQPGLPLTPAQNPATR